MYHVIQVTESAGETASIIYNFESLNDAKANYYYFLSSCLSNTSASYFLAELIDGFGNILYLDHK